MPAGQINIHGTADGQLVLSTSAPQILMSKEEFRNLARFLKDLADKLALGIVPFQGDVKINKGLILPG